MLAETPAPLNAAQKAWATRRARQAARDDIKTISAGVSTPAPAYDPKKPVVDIWLDDVKVGCGTRRFVVLECGPRWVKLFYYPTLSTIRIDRLTFDRKARLATDSKKRTIANIIRRNVEQAKRINEHARKPVMPEGGSAAKQALAVLR